MSPGLPRFAAALSLLSAAVALSVAPARADDARKAQQIIFPEIPAHSVGDAPFEPLAHATSKLPLAYIVVAGPAVVDGKRIRLTGEAGLVIVRASQAGNAVYQPAADTERAFNVNGTPRPPAFTLQPEGARASIGDLIVLAAAATGEPLPKYQWTRNGVELPGAKDARLAIPNARPEDEGVYSVTATNSLGTARSMEARVTVARRSQAITFMSVQVVAGQPALLSVNASSGLPVSLEVVSGSGIINGSTLTAQGGMVVVQATQAGNTLYDAAPPVTQTFLVSAATNGTHF